MSAGSLAVELSAFDFTLQLFVKLLLFEWTASKRSASAPVVIDRRCIS